MKHLGWAVLALAIATPFACSRDRAVEENAGTRATVQAALVRTSDGNVETGYMVHHETIAPGDTGAADPTMSSDDTGEAGRDDHNTE